MSDCSHRWWDEQPGETPGAPGTLDDVLVGLLEDVEEDFLAHDPVPGWADPHPDLELPAPEEYSRLQDPGKYAIVPQRLMSWVRVLRARGLAHGEGAPDQVPAVLRPVHGEGSALLVTLREEVDGFVATELRLTEDTEPVLSLPVCGCDACDDGSQKLIQELDEAVLAVVEGAIEISQTTARFTVRTADGGRSGSRDPDHAREHPGTVQVRGSSWIPGHRSRPVIDLP